MTDFRHSLLFSMLATSQAWPRCSVHSQMTGHMASDFISVETKTDAREM